MKRGGPWTQAMLDQLRADIEGYFRVYYSELRRLVTEYEDADLPPWLKGGRVIDTSCCTDGVVVGHTPHDPESWTHPEQEDTYKFRLAVENGVMWPVSALVHRTYGTERGDETKMRAMPLYLPGEDFGVFVRLWPAHEDTPAADGYALSVISHWTRLDAVSMSHLDRWRDQEVAHREAWEAVRPYVEGSGAPALGDAAPPRPAR